MKRFDAILLIRHDSVMRNDGRNAVWDMWCGLQCMWDNVMCDLYLNLAMCMA